MQIKTFFADCDKAIEVMVNTLQDKPVFKIQQPIVRLSGAEAINMVASQYKQEPTLFVVKDHHKRIVHYLNLLSLELKAQGQAQFQQQSTRYHLDQQIVLLKSWLFQSPLCQYCF